MADRTTIQVTQAQKKALKRVKRQIEHDIDDGLTMGEALTMLAESYLDTARAQSRTPAEHGSDDD